MNIYKDGKDPYDFVELRRKYQELNLQFSSKINLIKVRLLIHQLNAKLE